MFRSANLLFVLVGDAGFEPTAFGAGGPCSVIAAYIIRTRRSASLHLIYY